MATTGTVTPRLASGSHSAIRRSTSGLALPFMDTGIIHITGTHPTITHTTATIRVTATILTTVMDIIHITEGITAGTTAIMDMAMDTMVGTVITVDIPDMAITVVITEVSKSRLTPIVVRVERLFVDTERGNDC